MRPHTLIALVLLAPAATALDWVTPEGPATASGVMGSDGEGDPTPMWRHTFPGTIEAIAPAGALVLVSSGQMLQALDARSGEVRWSHDAGERNVTSVVVAGGVAYALEASDTRKYSPRAQRIFALDAATGAERWSTNAQGEFVGELTLSEGRVLVGSTTGVLALDADDGSLAWTVPLDANKPLAPLPGLVGALIPDAAVALRAEDGTEAWRIARPGCMLTVSDRIAYQDGVLYIGGQAGAGECIGAYDLATQEPLWTLRTPFERNYTPTTPIPQGDRVYLSVGSAVRAYDAKTGEEVWRNDQLGDGGMTDMLVGPTRVFAAHLLGSVSVIDAQTGANVTRFRADGTDGPVGPDAPGIRDPFVVADGILFATQYREKATLHALDIGGRDPGPAKTTSEEGDEAGGGFPWWIVLLVAATAIGVGVVVWRRQKKR